MLNQLVYDFATWLDAQAWSTLLHESYYMYNWVETTHVLSLMISLGMLFLIDLRMLGYAFPNVPASSIAERLNKPMLVGFSIMMITGVLLFYAIPVRSSQSLWFRIKVVLLVAAAVNALLFRNRMATSVATWDTDARAPKQLRIGAALSLGFWALIVVSGRLIAYDWFDCAHGQSGIISSLAGCVPGQEQF
jgi:hypothetical protein